MRKKDREVFHNRDMKVKISLINHVQYFFNFQNIDEKVIRLLATELIDREYSNLRMDFLVECVSGNIYNIEGETQPVNDNTVNKTWKYIKELMCRNENDIYSIIITLSENNKITTKNIGSVEFKPILCEMKKFNGDEYINIIRDKFENREELTIEDCAIIENIPDMKNTKDESDVVEELCEIIRDANINNENRIKLQSTMWLNIDYYVKDENKRKELMEMIKVQESQDEYFYTWQDEIYNSGQEQGIEKGIKKGKNETIKQLLKTMTPEEISEKLEIPLSEVKLTSK